MIILEENFKWHLEAFASELLYIYGLYIWYKINCFDKSSDVTKYGKYKPVFNYGRYELKLIKTDLDKYKP